LAQFWRLKKQEKIRAIIIDDEERARRILQSIVEEYCTEIEIIDTCSNVPDGVLSINKHNPDLVFFRR